MAKVNANEVSETAKKKLRPTAKMGGSVTKNGVNVDKEIEAQTARKRSTSTGYMPSFKKVSRSPQEMKAIGKAKRKSEEHPL